LPKIAKKSLRLKTLENFMRSLFFLLLLSFGANAQVFSIYFDTDKSAIKTQFNAGLDSAIVISKQTQGALEIACHCDNRADSTYNYHLSMRRAKAVQAYLLQRGVQSTLQIVGFGEDNPAYPNTAAERYKNRRCDVKLQNSGTEATANSVQNFTSTDVGKLVPGSLLKLDGLEFVGNQAVPNYYSMTVLYQVLKTMREHPQLEIFLKGHVCCGDDYPLSVARAKAVYDFLGANGIAKERMQFEGYSNTQPAVEEVDDETEQQNRRVEMLVVKTGPASKVIEEQTNNFKVVLREIYFTSNTAYADKTGEYNLNLLAEMIAGSNGYLYVLEVFSPNKSLMAQRRNYIAGIMKRNGIAKTTMVIIPMRNADNYKEDILILEVKRQANE